MGMIGHYLRLDDATLTRVRQEHDWALEHALALGADGSPRALDIDKAWDAIGHLLRRADFPVEVVHGEQEIAGAHDWGYGPPRLLPADRVRLAAAELPEFAVLSAGVPLAELDAAGVYPSVWDSPDEDWSYTRAHYEALHAFLTAAAAAEEAVVTYIA